LKLEGLAGDPALRHGAGLSDHVSLVPATPAYDYEHGLSTINHQHLRTRWILAEISPIP
jgi:hypothetical protein